MSEQQENELQQMINSLPKTRSSQILVEEMKKFLDENREEVIQRTAKRLMEEQESPDAET